MIPGRWLAGRSRIYAGLSFCLFLMAVVFGFTNGRHHGVQFLLVESDGRLYYAYLPSAVLDGDLDFANQIREHWDISFDPTMLEERTATGLIPNKYPIGFALTLLPAFLLGHLIALVSGGAIPADGYSWPYQIACVAEIEVLVWLTLRRIDRILTDGLGVSAEATLAAIAVVVFGTPYFYYAIREPFMVHVVSAFWCTEFVAATVDLRLKPAATWPRLGFAAAMALVCRPTNAYLLPVGLLGLVRRVRTDGWSVTLKCLPLAAVGIVPIALQMLAWQILNGSWLSYSYGVESFHWTNPALLKTLFSSQHGLYFWSPILLVATVALLWRLRDPLVLCWLLGGMLLWYANSAWHNWWFGAAFGARAFVELTGLFAVGLAFLFTSLHNRPRLAATIAALAILWNLVLTALYVKHWIPAEAGLLAW